MRISPILATVLLIVACLVAASPAPAPPNAPKVTKLRAPNPADMVCVDTGLQTVSSSGDVRVIYQVPTDRWLVVTRLLTVSETGDKSIDMVEASDDSYTVKITRHLLDFSTSPYVHSFDYPGGLVFAPGKVVGLRTGTGANRKIALNLVGYLVGA